MSTFGIDINPPIPSAAAKVPPLTFAGVNIGAVTDIYQIEHEVIYTIDGLSFTYYPTSILTVLNDLHWEWIQALERQSHEVTLSGYTVLQLKFEESGARFFHPTQRLPDGREAPIGESFDPAFIEEIFRSATAAVWGFVATII